MWQSCICKFECAATAYIGLYELPNYPLHNKQVKLEFCSYSNVWIVDVRQSRCISLLDDGQVLNIILQRISQPPHHLLTNKIHLFILMFQTLVSHIDINKWQRGCVRHLCYYVLFVTFITPSQFVITVKWITLVIILTQSSNCAASVMYNNHHNYTTLTKCFGINYQRKMQCLPDTLITMTHTQDRYSTIYKTPVGTCVVFAVTAIHK